MAYVEGFVIAVPATNKQAYKQQAEAAVSLFKGLGASRVVEGWGDDVPEGEITDFRGAVKAKPDEIIVFSWCEYPSRQVRDAANEKLGEDPQMMGAVPFDAQRMIYGGFSILVDEGSIGNLAYTDGSLVPVPLNRKDAYLQLARKQAAILLEHGASRVVEAWGDDLPDGEHTDYKGAVRATGKETVVFSWVEWSSKLVRDAAWQKVFADPRMYEQEMPYDGLRRVYGGFEPIVDR